LLNLCIHPDHQRCGLASDLLRKFLATATAARCERIFLEVRQSNHAALALYGRAGFKAAGLRRKYYRAVDGREDAIVLSRSIDSG
ncbi:MAG: GNAT family N-acetyltransferase, partial [Gammaproteobacteria bacterium]